MEQRVEELSVADKESLARQRDWLLGHYSDGDARVYQSSYAGPIVLAQTILDEGWVESHETWKLQCLGIALGDALEGYLGLEWVAVEDKHGRDPALRDTNGTLLFPMTMIAKRIENKEEFDVMSLFKALAAYVRDLRGKSS